MLRKDKIVILDFDHTIFNTELFKRHLKTIFLRYGITSDRYEQTYNYIRKKLKRPYDPALHVRLLEGEITDIKSLMTEVNGLVANSKNYLYEDVISFLESVKDDCELFLVSLGVKRFQQPKIDNCKINGFFTKVLLTEGEGGLKKDILKDLINENRDKKIAIIEDVPENIDYIKRGFSYIIAIKIERPGGKYSESKAELNNFTVKGLYQATNIVKCIL
ncbi:MAG: HAD hydrolase-like protein [Patescibacteria group bacterium]|jgi:FMN phosphatase YigB (HAD superfamily)